MKKTDLIALISYHGGKFNGWQSQGGASGTSRFVQEVCQATLGKVLQSPTPIPLLATSRTDAGVHARELLLHTSYPTSDLAGVSPLDLKASWNAQLPVDIKCTHLRYALPSQIQVRYASSGKSYSYYLRTGSYTDGLSRSMGDFSMYVEGLTSPPLLSRLAAAVAIFQGTHDFSAFSMGRSKVTTSGSGETITAADGEGGSSSSSSKAAVPRGTSLRTISSATVSVIKEDVDWGVGSPAPLDTAGELIPPPSASTPLPPPMTPNGVGGMKRPREDTPAHLIRLRFVGNGFLRHQIRHMVGAALGVVKGHATLEGLQAALRGESVGKHPGRYVSAAARGLWLERVVLVGEGFWEEKEWCNNRDPAYLTDNGLTRAHWHPERKGVDGRDASKIQEGGEEEEEEEEEVG